MAPAAVVNATSLAEERPLPSRGRAEAGDADQVAGFKKVWDDFLALDRPVAHRPDWARWANGRSQHLLLLARLRDPRVLAALVSVQQALRGVPGVELHPPRFLHLSIQSLGFRPADGVRARSDEIEPAEVARVVPALAACLAELPAFPVHLGGLNAFYSSVFLEVRSAGRLQHARQVVRAAARPVVWRVDPFAGFLFHLTLGYFEAGATTDAVRAAIAPWRHRRFATAWVEALELVSLPTDQREPFPTFTSLARFPLAGLKNPSVRTDTQDVAR